MDTGGGAEQDAVLNPWREAATAVHIVSQS